MGTIGLDSEGSRTTLCGLSRPKMRALTAMPDSSEAKRMVRTPGFPVQTGDPADASALEVFGRVGVAAGIAAPDEVIHR